MVSYPFQSETTALPDKLRKEELSSLWRALSNEAGPSANSHPKKTFGERDTMKDKEVSAVESLNRYR
jgi:hypothetical protein